MDIAGFWKASSRQLSQRKNRVYPEQKQSIEDEEPISYPNGSRPGMPISGFCSAASRHLSPRIYRVYPDQKQSIGVEEPISYQNGSLEQVNIRVGRGCGFAWLQTGGWQL